VIAANRVHPCQGENRDIVNLCPWQRLTISLNNKPQRMLVLPHLNSRRQKQITLSRATSSEIPMPTETSDDERRFWEALMLALPGYLYWLEDEFEIPPDSNHRSLESKSFAILNCWKRSTRSAPASTYWLSLIWPTFGVRNLVNGTGRRWN
jgi:hypothetical protein